LEIWVGGYLKFHSKPVVILDPFDTYKSLKLLLDDLGAEQLMKPGQREVVHWSSAVPDSIAHLRERI